MIPGFDKMLDLFNAPLRPPAPENVVRGMIPFDPGHKQEMEELRKELWRVTAFKNSYSVRYDEVRSDLDGANQAVSRLREENRKLKEAMEAEQTRFDILDL